METTILMKRNTLKNIYLIGSGGHAKSCIDVIESTNQFNIKGLFGYEEEVGASVLDYKVIDKVENCYKYKGANNYFIISIGMVTNSKLRKEIYEKYSNILKFTKIISPRSYVSKSSNIKKGTIIMHDALINVNSQIGYNCIINTKSLIEHDAIIHDHCHISTSAVINGSAEIGNNSFIGSKSVIKNGLKLKENSFVPMGRKITNINKIILNYE